MFKKIALAVLTGCFLLAAMAAQAAVGYGDSSAEAAYAAGAIGQMR